MTLTSFRMHKDTTSVVNLKTQLPKFNVKAVRVHTGPKASTGQNRRHHDGVLILDTITNNCPDPYKQRGFEASVEYQKWVKRAWRKTTSAVISIRLKKYADQQLRTCESINQGYWKQWSSRYARSMYCCHTVQQDGNKLNSMYCTQKWCSICQRNRSAKQINAYGDQLEKLNDVQFVTLTIASVKGEDLGHALDKMNSIWRNIYKKMHRDGLKPMGIRTVEHTHGDKGYHPHFHILISGEDNANMVKELWLEFIKEDASKGGKYVANAKGQDVTPCIIDEDGSIKKAIIETFKYAVKTSKGGEMYPPDVIHTINQASFGRQMASPFGIKKSKQDTKAPERQTSQADWLKAAKVCYNWDGFKRSWMNKYDRDMLSL